MKGARAWGVGLSHKSSFGFIQRCIAGYTRVYAHIPTSPKLNLAYTQQTLRVRIRRPYARVCELKITTRVVTTGKR